MPEPDDSASLRELGSFLAKTIAFRGLTDSDLAKVAGVSRSNIKFAREGSNITVLTLLKLARALEIRSLDIIGLTLGRAPAEDDGSAAAEGIEEATAHMLAAVAILRKRSIIASEISRVPRDETDRNASALVRDVFANAATLGPDRLARLYEALHGLVDSAQHEARSPNRKRVSKGSQRPK